MNNVKDTVFSLRKNPTEDSDGRFRLSYVLQENAPSSRTLSINKTGCENRGKGECGCKLRPGDHSQAPHLSGWGGGQQAGAQDGQGGDSRESQGRQDNALPSSFAPTRTKDSGSESVVS